MKLLYDFFITIGSWVICVCLGMGSLAGIKFFWRYLTNYDKGEI